MLGNLRCHHEIYCKSVPTYGHRMLLLLLFVLFPLQTYVFMPPPLPTPTPQSKTTSVYRRKRRHLIHSVYLDRGGCNWLCIIDPHDSWNVTCPLPCTSTPASWTLLSPISVQDSSNISSNDRHHHKLSSLDHKTGILYLFPNVSLMFI